MTDVLDDLDRKILQSLQEDGRTPVAQIAERIGLSRPAVAERMEKLERAGVIRGTTAVIDHCALGNEVTAFASVRRSGVLDAKVLRAFRELLRRPEILEAHTVSGEDCYLLKIRTSSMSELNRIISLFHAAPLLMSTRTTIVMETHCEKVGGITLSGGLFDEA